MVIGKEQNKVKGVEVMGNYIKENTNPKGHLSSDYEIRALSKATGKSWEEVFKGLYEIAYRNRSMLDEKKVLDEYVRSVGFVYRKLPKVEAGGSRPKVSSFAKQLGKGTYLLIIANQITVAINGNYYEVWNCGNKAVYGYWEKV